MDYKYGTLMKLKATLKLLRFSTMHQCLRLTEILETVFANFFFKSSEYDSPRTLIHADRVAEHTLANLAVTCRAFMGMCFHIDILPAICE
jgi:hypothetical protein